MPAKKVPAVKEVAGLAKQDPDKFKAIKQIADLADGFTTVTVTEDNLEKAVEVIARSRAAAKQLEELHASATKDLKAQIKPFDADRSKLKKSLELAGAAVAEAIIGLYRTVSDKGALERRMAGALGSTATVVPNGYEIEVLDADAIPDEYILPVPGRAARVNMAMLQAAAADGRTIPGVAAVPKYYLLTRAADIVKRVK